MKILLLLLGALVTMQVSAQKLLPPKIDKISGDTTFATSLDRIASDANMFGAVVVSGTIYRTRRQYSLFFEVVNAAAKSHVFEIDPGDIAIIKMATGKLDTLTCISGGISDTKYSNYGSRNLLRAGYVLHPSNVLSLSSDDIAFIRIQTKSEQMDFDVKGKQAWVIRKQILLLKP